MAAWTFVRHGQSEANAEGWLAGHADAPLTVLGHEQATRARSELPTRPPLGRAYCSDLSRAHETARILLAGRDVPLVVDARLRERGCGAWEHRPIADLAKEVDLGVLAQWTGRPPDGESLRDLALRVLPYLSSIDDGTDALVVCHGALMCCILGLVDREPRENVGLWRPKNCEFVRRDLPQGSWAAILEAVVGS